MLARITNYGRPVSIPTRIGPFFLNRLCPVEVGDPAIIKTMQRFSQTDGFFLKVEVLEVDQRPVQSAIDYGKYPVNELRSIAANMGIKNSFFMRKTELLRQIEGGQNG